MVIGGGWEFNTPFFDDFFILMEQGFLLVLVQPLGVAPFAFHGVFPILSHNAEMDLIHITVLNHDIGLRVIPHALNCDIRGFGFDLIDEVMAHRATGCFRESVTALRGNFVRLDFVSILIKGLS